MDAKELKRQVAHLESKVDMLQSELLYLDQLLHKCGFPEGIHTLKGAAIELLEEAQHGSSSKNV